MRGMLLAWVGLLLCLLHGPGCSERPEAVGVPTVVCTIAMIADVAREIGGERVEVLSLMGAGVDPHLYKPTRSDIDLILRADMVLYNGLMLEGKMNDLLVRTASQRAVHRVTEGLSEGELLEPAEFMGHYDPHVWMDPLAWSSAAGVIRDRLIDLMPQHEAEFRARAQDYQERLRDLDTYARGVLESVPSPRRVLVTAHDAFNYLGRRYGLEVVGIQGLSTESEAALRDIERLADMIVEREVPSVFVESTVSSKGVEALIAGARQRGREVRIAGELFSDAMGAQGTYEGTYIGMIDHNVTTIARGLGGDAPERGMNGRLSH